MSESERLLVEIRANLDQFLKAMKQAERSGTWTYQKLVDGSAKATTAIEKRMQDTAKAMGRSIESIFGDGSQFKNRGEFLSAARDFTESAAAVDRLRASMDPLYAASKRYEQAVRDLDNALERGAINQAEHTRLVGQAASTFLTADTAAANHATGLGRLGNMSNATKANIQNMGFQIQDVAVQIAGGTSAARALSQQLPQMLGGFGLVGVAVGTLAAVGLPLLTAAFGSTGAAAQTFDQAMSDVQNSVRAMNEQAAIYTAEGLVALKEKYGEVNAELLLFIERQTEATQRQAVQDTRDAMAALVDETKNWWNITAGMQDIFPDIAGQVNHLVNGLEQLQNARTFDQQLAAATALRIKIEEVTGGIGNMTDRQFKFYNSVRNSEDALRQMVAQAPKQGWLAAAIAQAETLAARLWNAVDANLALAQAENTDAAGNPIAEGVAGKRPRQAPSGIGGVDWGTAPAGRGGGGGGGGGGSGRIDSLIADLQTEREVVEAWYAESLTMINTATEAQLGAVGGRHEALERLEREHQERLRGIRDESNAGALANAETFFGALATITAAGGGKLAKIHQVAAALEGAINIGRAQLQTLADPKLSFWQKLPAMAAIGGAGMKVLSAIKSGTTSTGSGGGSAATSSTSAAPSAEASTGPLEVTVKGLDPGALFTGKMVMDLFDAMQKEAGNRGIAPVWL